MSEADKRRVNRAIDMLIDAVRDGHSRPDRTWATAMHALFKRREALENEERPKKRRARALKDGTA